MDYVFAKQHIKWFTKLNLLNKDEMNFKILSYGDLQEANFHCSLPDNICNYSRTSYRKHPEDPFHAVDIGDTIWRNLNRPYILPQWEKPEKYILNFFQEKVFSQYVIKKYVRIFFRNSKSNWKWNLSEKYNLRKTNHWS